MTTMPTRVDGDLFRAAKSAGEFTSRSAAQQINHWARLGRELEASPQVSQRDVQRVLAGTSTYSTLNEREQAIVRAEWDERITEGIAALDFEAEFTAAGDTWVIGDGRGNAVIRSAGAAGRPVNEIVTAHDAIA